MRSLHRALREAIQALTSVAESSSLAPHTRLSAVHGLAQLLPHVDALTALNHLARSTIPEIKAAAASRLTP